VILQGLRIQAESLLHQSKKPPQKHLQAEGLQQITWKNALAEIKIMA